MESTKQIIPKPCIRHWFSFSKKQLYLLKALVFFKFKYSTTSLVIVNSSCFIAELFSTSLINFTLNTFKSILSDQPSLNLYFRKYFTILFLETASIYEHIATISATTLGETFLWTLSVLWSFIDLAVVILFTYKVNDLLSFLCDFYAHAVSFDITWPLMFVYHLCC